MNKVCIIYSGSSSTWKSCNSIKANLYAIYKRFDFEINDVVIDKNINDYHYYKICEKIFSEKYAKIIFIDFEPLATNFLKFFKEFEVSSDTEIIVHVYGDFSLASRSWLSIEEVLFKLRIKFLCASDAQVKLLKQFIPDEYVFLCPFSFDSGVFNVSESSEVITSFNFIYSGRMTLQKNITELITSFANFINYSSADAFLYLAGPFDDIGRPYLGDRRVDGSYFNSVINLIESLPKEIQDRVRICGDLSSQELNKLCNLSHCFISLSTHNDEDYGMSPVEGLATGLPAILSKWGGYNSYDFENLVEYIDIDESFSFSNDMVSKKMFKMYCKYSTLTKEQRLKNSQIVNRKFSQQVVFESLKNILNIEVENFKGYKNKFRTFSNYFHPDNNGSFLKIKRTYDEFYKDVYESYR